MPEYKMMIAAVFNVLPVKSAVSIYRLGGGRCTVIIAGSENVKQ